MKPAFSILLKRSIKKSFLLMLILCSILIHESTKADAVSDWNATMVSVQLRVPALNRGLCDFAYLHISIYDAVNAINPTNIYFAINPPNKVSWANLEAAVHSAARRILMRFYAADSVYIDSVYQSRMSLLADDSTKTKGAEIGNTTAEMYLALRSGDGRDANIPYVWQPFGPGVYQPTPPGSPQYVPVSPWQAQLRPFSFDSSSQFRAPAPPLLTSPEYAADYNEVKMYGSLDSTNTTPEMREIARFHTENPGVHVPRNIRLFASSQNLSLMESARFFAQVFVSIGDALISGWNSKYFYNRWRPSTAIRNADIDGNSTTLQDTSWQPLVATPRHPEYPAAHGVVSGAIAYTIENLFGTNTPITLTSTVTGTQHSFSNINDYVTEISNARVWGGMHFRFSCNEGLIIGQTIANHVADHFFQIVPVELIGFNSSVIDNDITLTWITATETNNQGFEIERLQNSEITKLQYWEKIGFVNGKGTTTEQQFYSYYDQDLPTGKYQYRLKQIDFDGSFEYSNIIEVDVRSLDNFSLEQNYPNPFNPSTTIGYVLHEKGNIRLTLMNAIGEEVVILVNEEQDKGYHKVELDGKNLSSGVYYYQLNTNGFIQTKKLILMK